jgi:archaemetzincin
MKRIACLMALSACAKEPPARPPAPAPAPQMEPDVGHERMPDPQPGDWLYRFPEKGQTFERYTAACRNRRSTERSVIYLQPMGTMDERYAKTLKIMREYCEIFFGTACVVRDPIPLPEHCLILPRRQYNSTMLIGHLVENHLPKDALAMAGITSEDLFSKGLNFVFGEGSLVEPVGVYSLHRFGNDWPLFLERGLKLVTHELGHVLGLEHCIWYKCVMSGANSLAEGDRYPMHACPIDLRKLEWNLGFDRLKRYEKLEAFYRAQELPEAADWVRRRRETVR